MTASTPEQQRASRDRARLRAAVDPSLIPHGTGSGYNYWGCRCAPCTAAVAPYGRASMRRFRGRQRAAAGPGV